jgi:3-isopropylmalate/(R)-2-methylmalate dehydratase small subunit
MSTAPFTTLDAVAVPLLRADVDTDMIMPSREMKFVGKTGLADGVFAGLRYQEIGGRTPNPDFVLNDRRYAGAQLLLSGANFGCGSSREHAVWGLAEYGFRAIIAESFNPIFYANCTRNGVLPIMLPADAIASLARSVMEAPQSHRIHVNLPAQEVRGPDGVCHGFAIAREAKEMLMHGLDAIGLTLQRRDVIQAFRDRDREHRPWIYL